MWYHGCLFQWSGWWRWCKAKLNFLSNNTLNCFLFGSLNYFLWLTWQNHIRYIHSDDVAKFLTGDVIKLSWELVSSLAIRLLANSIMRLIRNFGDQSMDTSEPIQVMVSIMLCDVLFQLVMKLGITHWTHKHDYRSSLHRISKAICSTIVALKRRAYSRRSTFEHKDTSMKQTLAQSTLVEMHHITLVSWTI